jgi:hypothetical protein
VLRPIDSNLSILNSEQRANQIRDPSAHHVQTLQQDELAKKVEHEKQSVQQTDKTDEDVKIKARKDERERGERRGGKKRNFSPGADAPEEEKNAESPPTSGLNFLA